MTQRVKIQYTVGVDELEEEVQRLVTKAFKKLKGVAGQYPADNNILPLSLQMIDKIDDARLSLLEVDRTLHDVVDIVSAYVSFRSSPPAQQNAPDNNVNSELLEKINDFKKMIATNESSDEISD